ncbi:hypothetical protein EJB05_37610 [Eragrostis curvula]|uniref:Protein kinase domain-containing protein n=1 Tax=Eragrostis curvula TaxID=38414 RepID=A0A5J9TRZ6_9POAL|nr:hypothetical protein EJB05_37610 [Eragrostis curvula]
MFPPPRAMAPALLLLALLAAGAAQAANDLSSDTAALQAFLSPFGSAAVLWNSSTPVCSWVGVVCAGGRVTEIHLPGDGLRGSLPVGVLGRLTKLAVLSLRFNALSGTLPADLAACVELKVINLQSNLLSGELPAAVLALPALTQLNLAGNRFSGRIPPAIARNGKLEQLYLDGNRLTGQLPDVNMPSLNSFNVSFNNLTGEIPRAFAGLPATSFLGMSLCGKPLPPCGASPGTQPPSSQPPAFPPEAGASPDGHHGGRHHLSGGAIAGIVIGCAFGFLLIAAVLLLVCGATRRRQPRTTYRSQDAVAAELALRGKEAMSPNGYTPRVSDARPPLAPAAQQPPPYVPPAVAVPATVGKKKLFFFGRVPRPYDLEDLLRASAEVLGKGTYGTTYKAAIETGPVMAVKRLKETSLPEREFRDKVAAIGGIDHPNVVPLQAYYFSKDEKLMVYEFVAMGSLSSMLHGNRGSGRTPLSWESRRRIALASARGLEYIHATGSMVTHGNIKSSNILLSRSVDARVADHGLAHLVGPAGAPSSRVAGYRAPEVVSDPRRLSQKGDVYSFGVLLLELLTGKAPTSAALRDDGVDLPRWARSVVKEEWTSEVFEAELLRHPGAEEEMVEMLRLAMDCTATAPDHRPAMPEVAARIEELGRTESARSGRSASMDEADDRPLRPTASIRQS